jgi:membrane protease YdiL (CAAX protease family)
LKKPPTERSLATSLLLFLVVFGLWQLHDFILSSMEPSDLAIYLLYLAIPSASLVTFVVFVKLTRSSFKNQGYRRPTFIKTKHCIGLALLCLAIYFLIFLSPGFSTGISFLGIRTDPFLLVFRVVSAVIFGVAGESVFRGYIFRKLSRNYGFLTSLYTSALLFSLHQVVVRNLLTMSIDQLGIFVFTDVLVPFVGGLFLGFLFYKTGWSLLAPVIFRIGIYYYFDPLAIASPPDVSWWVAIAFEMASYAALILMVDYAIKEPAARRRKYGLES